ncbi:asparagine--tRNA ligase [Candidatus Woesearchaeota archaeon]|nr:asparagine--tRNA ligase [Candidatus Woesearchaeota archaeon]
MLGPYTAEDDGVIGYKGNRVFPKNESIDNYVFTEREMAQRHNSIANDGLWGHVANINHQIAQSTIRYFNEQGALFTLLPLTTRMISSPGAFYGREALDYTTDTAPITLDWFDLGRKAFLAESSQIYLELALMQQGVDQVYAIYNSFRKEEADTTHLSEFHHIEYEGKISQQRNEQHVLGLTKNIINDVLNKQEPSLAYFLDQRDLKELQALGENIERTPVITLQEALQTLYLETKDDKYRPFTLEHFRSWEEVKLTEIYGTLIGVNEFPLLEVPFYHAVVDGKEPAVADNTDFIWPGYREYVGSGQRIRGVDELSQKADIFNLPKEDYAPYLQSRMFDTYRQTAGFGMGWERLLQGLLKMPTIWSASAFPRGHTTLKP